MENFKKDGRKLSASFVTGAVALVFLIIGYQSALFIHKASVARIIADRDNPDTVFIVSNALAEMEDGPGGESGAAGTNGSEGGNLSGNRVGKGRRTEVRKGQAPVNDTVRKDALRSDEAAQAYRAVKYRKKESFRFDPNTVSIDDLMRLGFSLKQAQSIDNYRKKGGRFRRKEDFAKSYVVADSVYRRLEPYISIPLLDINEAENLYKEMGKVFPKKHGWSYSIICPSETFERSFGRKADKRRKLYNGMIKCDLYMYFKG